MSSINFDLRRLRGIAFDVDGVLSPCTIALGADGQPLRQVNIKDGYAMQLAVKHGLQLAIITGAKSHGVEVRYQGLGVQHIYTGAGVKVPVFEQWLQATGLTADQVAYVGDDIPDMQVMQRVALAVAPADAAPEIKAVAHYISHVNGGYGVARDLLEQVMKAQGLWLDDQHAFGW